MTPFDPIAIARRTLGRLKALRDEIRTRRLIAGLPAELRKDIGWPDVFEEPRRNRRNRFS